MRLGGGTKSSPELQPSFLLRRPLALQEGRQARDRAGKVCEPSPGWCWGRAISSLSCPFLRPLVSLRAAEGPVKICQVSKL